jgi:hypothetical protein
MEKQEPKSESILTGLLRASKSLLEHEQHDPTFISHLEASCSRGVDRVFKESANIYAGAEVQQLLDFMDPSSGHLNKRRGS